MQSYSFRISLFEDYLSRSSCFFVGMVMLLVTCLFMLMIVVMIVSRFCGMTRTASQ